MKRADDTGMDLVIGTIEDARRDPPAVEQSGASPLAIRQGLAHHHSRGAVPGPLSFLQMRPCLGGPSIPAASLLCQSHSCLAPACARAHLLLVPCLV